MAAARGWALSGWPSSERCALTDLAKEGSFSHKVWIPDFPTGSAYSRDSGTQQ